MASGDAQKVWFPELIEMVRQAGAPAMSMDALLRLRVVYLQSAAHSLPPKTGYNAPWITPYVGGTP